jgi:C-terminal processing protease CtpA/Prc
LSEYGERYKLFVIKKNSFEKKFDLEEYGVNLAIQDNKTVVDTLKWNGEAKKAGLQTGDYITEFKIENLDRPRKALVYPVAILFLIIFGYLNYRRKD